MAKQNLEGLPLRSKIRVRFYNDNKPDLVYLEIKSKDGDIGNRRKEVETMDSDV